MERASSVLGSTLTVIGRDVSRLIPGRNFFAMDAVFESTDDTWTLYTHMVTQKSTPYHLTVREDRHGHVCMDAHPKKC
eukprot:scaffold1000_cov166-Amphora_coffeaeformis.AAC.39